VARDCSKAPRFAKQAAPIKRGVRSTGNPRDHGIAVTGRAAQKGVPNPFKPGELMDRPAKPAYNKVKVRALKLLKDMAKQPG
jgi:hypothetical protein